MPSGCQRSPPTVGWRLSGRTASTRRRHASSTVRHLPGSPAHRGPCRSRARPRRRGGARPRQRSVPQRLARLDGARRLGDAAPRARSRVRRRSGGRGSRGARRARRRAGDGTLLLRLRPLRGVPDGPPEPLPPRVPAGLRWPRLVRRVRVRATRRRQHRAAPRGSRIRRGGQSGLPLHDVVRGADRQGAPRRRRVAGGGRLRRGRSLRRDDRRGARRQRDRGRPRRRSSRQGASSSGPTPWYRPATAIRRPPCSS